MGSTGIVSGICPRCGTAVSAFHSKPMCDAAYDAAYARARTASRKPTVEEAEAILLLVRGGWLRLTLDLEDS